MESLAKKERIREFDIARVIAVFLMVAVHTEFAIYDYGNETFGKVFDYLGSPFAAPIFMFVLGANMYLSSHNTPKQLFVRGVTFFFLSFVFNIICHALPFFILDYKNGVANFLENSLHWIFAVDILTFAGLAFMFFALAKKLRLNGVILVIIGMAFSLLNFILTKCFPIDFERNTALAVVTGLFYNSSVTGYFSFMGWIIIPIVGYVFVQIREKVKNKNLFYGILGIICLVVYVVMVYGSFNRVTDAPLVDFSADEYLYYQMPPYAVVGTLAFCFAWISLMYFVAKIIPKCMDKHILRINKNITAIYVIQWFIINYCFVLASNGTLQVNEWQYILCFIAVIVASDLIAFVYGRYKKWSLSA